MDELSDNEQKLAELLDPDRSGPAPELDDLSQRRFVDAVLDGFDEGLDLDGEGPGASHSTSARVAARVNDSRRMRWTMGLSAVAAAGVVAVLGLQAFDALGPTEAQQVDTVADAESRVVVPPGGRLAVVSDGKTNLWLASDSVVRVPTSGRAIHLDRGRAVGRFDRDEPFVIHTARGRVEIAIAVVAVEVAGSEVGVRVYEGAVSVSETGGGTRSVEAGQSVTLGVSGTSALDPDLRVRDFELLGEEEMVAAAPEPELPARIEAVDPELPLDEEEGEGHPETPRQALRPEAAAATLDELLLRAAGERASKKWKAASRTYREILRRFPDRPESCTAHLSLAQLSLDRLGDAKGALKAYERHAEHCTGAELEESAWGRARALRRLDRRAQEREALESFVVRHGRSLRLAEAWTRLGELDRAAGRCADAIAHFDAALAAKPGARVEKAARFGSAHCALDRGNEAPAKAFIERWPESKEADKLRARF